MIVNLVKDSIKDITSLLDEDIKPQEDFLMKNVIKFKNEGIMSLIDLLFWFFNKNLLIRTLYRLDKHEETEEEKSS